MTAAEGSMTAWIRAYKTRNTGTRNYGTQNTGRRPELIEHWNTGGTMEHWWNNQNAME